MSSARYLILVLATVMNGYGATVAYSPPLGGMTLTVPAGQTRSFALPLLHESIGAGKMRGHITGVGSNYIDVSDAGWTVGGMSNATNPYYIRFLSGAARGRIMLVTTTANTASRLFLNTDGVAPGTDGGPAIGDEYELVLLDTLASLFGTSTLGGSAAGTADNVLIWGGASWQKFYYNTTRSRWEMEGISFLDFGNTVIRPDCGILFMRHAATDYTLRVNGRIRKAAAKFVHTRPGTSFLQLGALDVSTAASLTLSDLALQNLPGWVKGTTEQDSDTVQLWTGASWQTFYFSTSNNRWQLAGVTFLDMGATKLAGRPFLIKRNSAGSAVDSVITMPLPYTL